jgi:hypothetical protein
MTQSGLWQAAQHGRTEVEFVFVLTDNAPNAKVIVCVAWECCYR